MLAAADVLPIRFKTSLLTQAALRWKRRDALMEVLDGVTRSVGRAGAPLGAGRGAGWSGVAQHAAGTPVAALYDAMGRSAGCIHVTGM